VRCVWGYLVVAQALNTEQTPLSGLHKWPTQYRAEMIVSFENHYTIPTISLLICHMLQINLRKLRFLVDADFRDRHSHSATALDTASKHPKKMVSVANSFLIHAMFF
jgi:hypothetical protein